MSLSRDGYVTNTYSNYSGTRLGSIGGFVNGSYSYDANGNMTSLVNKGGVQSNHTYEYACTKLRRSGGGSATRYYVDGIEYAGGCIDFIQTEEGIARRSGSTYNYEYSLKDHLGNTRYSFDIWNGGIRRIQQQDYYAFGLAKNVYISGTKNNYLYNGKELQEQTGQYDYGARFYDPVIARWMSIDPKAEKYMPVSSYSYALNNPVLVVDVDGRDIFIPITKGDFTQKAFNQIQALTSDRLALLTTGQVVRVSDISPSSTDMFKIHTIGNVTPSLLKKEFGTALVGTLLENDYKTTIRDVGGGSEVVEKGKSEAIVWHDANTDNRGIKNEDGSGGVSPQVALGHELIHVRNHIEGKTDNEQVTVKDPDSGSIKRMKREELNTRQDENKLRREQLEKNRAQPTPVN